MARNYPHHAFSTDEPARLNGTGTPYTDVTRISTASLGWIAAPVVIETASPDRGLIHGLSPSSLSVASGGQGGFGEFESGGNGGDAGQAGSATAVSGVPGGAAGTAQARDGGDGSNEFPDDASAGSGGGGGENSGTLGAGGNGGNGGLALTGGLESVGGGGGGGGGVGLISATSMNAFKDFGGKGGLGGNAEPGSDTFSANGGGGGDGGAGFVQLGSGNVLINGFSEIVGGDGGQGGQGSDATSSAPRGNGGNGGAGGAGIVDGDGNEVINTEIIQGGTGGSGGNGSQSGTIGPNGIGLVGSNMTVFNGGTISGGGITNGTPYGIAIGFYGGTNYLTLSSGGSVGVINGTIGMGGTVTIDPGTAPGTAVMLSNAIFDLAGPGTLIKAGLAELDLTGPLTYTGGTTVRTGELVVLGTMSGNGPLAVASGATFALFSGSRSASDNVAVSSNTGVVSLTGGTGADVFSFAVGGLHATDTVNGGTGAGLDRIFFTTAGTIAAGAFQNVTHIEHLVLANGTNSLTVPDALAASTDDGHILYLTGGTGNDTVNAGALTSLDRAYITAGSGNDTLTGGLGLDIFYFAAADLTSGDTVNGGGGTSVDVLDVTTAGTVAASAFQNVSHIEEIVLANGTNNVTVPDALVSSADDGHVLYAIGGTGNDTVNASAITTATNRIYFVTGNGNDNLTGGLGADDFFFTAADLTSGDTVNGGAGTSVDSILFTTAGTVAASAFTNVSHVEQLYLANGTNAVTLSNALAGSADDGHILHVTGGTGADTINAAAVTSAANRVVFIGGGGADTMTAGAGADIFAYLSASDSTSTGYDTVTGFNYATDRFDIPGGAGTITAVEAARNGALDSGANFDTELAARFSTLAEHHAGLLTASSGSLSGQTFLVIDLNGTAGYQAGSDLVLHLVSPTGTLVAADFI